eukprot:434715-Prymnesium_polylepis.1
MGRRVAAVPPPTIGATLFPESGWCAMGRCVLDSLPVGEPPPLDPPPRGLRAWTQTSVDGRSLRALWWRRRASRVVHAIIGVAVSSGAARRGSCTIIVSHDHGVAHVSGRFVFLVFTVPLCVYH